MSSNDIVVIKKEGDGKFRSYLRDYDAYCEGQYDYEGPCQFCENGCGMCDGKGYYTPPEENPIFEVDTVEKAIHAYNKWCQETMFSAEYGYTFENLEPNTKTVEVLEETDSYIIVKDNLRFILDHLRDTSNVGIVWVNCTPMMIKEKAEEALNHLDKALGIKTAATAEEMIKELHRDE